MMILLNYCCRNKAVTSEVWKNPIAALLLKRIQYYNVSSIGEGGRL